ncbi:uncharacterized protein LOC126656274 [Mercurialis annua]|uniref:uncharacterized protein LOC126656274 n=1 Tax=Mercurialis annua TaxID=3986 RepID=UPI0024AF45E8|nr:uncharacterized protein LOC126656274 [Mercurialis annua]
MAYYSSGYYTDDYGEYNNSYPLSYYYNNPGTAFVQDSTPYSSYNSGEYQSFPDNRIPFFAAYDDSVSRIGYSVSTYSEPKYIQHELPPHYHEQTRFVISYSVSEFNDDEFDDYDSTPYGGGYDLTLTYGKPLPPSDKTCYPRSSPSNGVSSEVIAEPVVKVVDEPSAEKPRVETKPTAEKPRAETKPTAEKPRAETKPTTTEEAEQLLDKPLDLYHSPQSGYDNGSMGENNYEHENQVAQISSGYGLEAMDLCEGLFGYWPCLSKYRKRCDDHRQETAADRGNHINQWKTTADYLFGTPYPYGETRDDDHGNSYYGNAIYGYQKHYQQPHQILYHQVKDSWSAY